MDTDILYEKTNVSESDIAEVESSLGQTRAVAVTIATAATATTTTAATATATTTANTARMCVRLRL